MRRSTAKGLLVRCAAATGLSLTTAITAQAAPEKEAESLISSLEASGYRVIVTPIGSGHQDNCVAQSVNKQSPVFNVVGARDMRNTPTSVPVSTKVAHVILDC